MRKERWHSLYCRSIGCPRLLTTTVTLAFCVLWMGAGIGSGWSMGIGRDHDGWDMVDTRLQFSPNHRGFAHASPRWDALIGLMHELGIPRQ